MSHPNPEPSAQRTATRAPVGRPIKLHFDDSLEAAEGICENISIGGMFILVENTRKPGSLVRFELRVDENTAIRGLGEVVWAQDRAESLGREPGVGIKFRFLEQRDRQLIFKLVSQHIKERLTKRHSIEADAGESPLDPSAVAIPPPPAEPSVTSPAAAPREVLRAVGTESEASVPAAGLTPTSFDRELDSLQENPAWNVARGPSTTEGPPAATSVHDGNLLPSRPASYVDAPAGVAGDGPSDLELERRPLDAGPITPETDHRYEASLGVEPEGTALGRVDYTEDDLEPDHYDLESYPAKRRLTVPLLALVCVASLALALFLFRDRLFGNGGGEIAPVETARGTEAPEEGEVPTQEPTTAARTEDGATPAEGEIAMSEPSPRAAETRPTAPPPSSQRQAAARREFSRVLDIGWSPSDRGLEVTIETDGGIREGRFRHFRLGGDSPREVIRILGLSRRFDRGEIAVDGTIVRRIRTGFHKKRGGDELHVVLDLADPAAQVLEVQAEGTRLLVTVGRP